MGLETGTYISALNAANPVTGDNKTEGDDHIRLLKATVLATFPNITGAVTPTHTQLNTITTAPTFSGNATAAIFVASADGGGLQLSQGTDYYDANANVSVINMGPSTTSWTIYADGVGPKVSITNAGAATFSGVIKGNAGGQGLGAITVSTSAPSGGALGDIWIQY